MNKDLAMRKFLKKHGGEYTRKDNRWYWSKNNSTPELVTTGFLLNYKEEPKVEEKVEIIEEIKIEVKEVKKSKPKKKIEVPQETEQKEV